MTSSGAVGHIEPIAAILRIGGAYGEPYTWAAMLRYLSPTEVELMGVTRPPKLQERRAIREVLTLAGVTRARIRRRRRDGGAGSFKESLYA